MRKILGIQIILWAFVVLAILIVSVPSVVARYLGENPAEIARNVSFSFIAAFIFYLVIDVFRQRRERAAAAPYISRQIRTMKGDIEAVCREAAQLARRELRAAWEFNAEEVTTIFKEVNPQSTVKLMFPDGRRANLFEHMMDRVRRTEDALGKLLMFSNLLGAEGVAKITDIQSDAYLLQLKMIFQLGLPRNTDLSFLTKLFVEHYEKVAALERWAHESNLLNYSSSRRRS